LCFSISIRPALSQAFFALKTWQLPSFILRPAVRHVLLRFVIQHASFSAATAGLNLSPCDKATRISF
ncbi:MAG: hypothetical protein IIZ76_08640, partial [Clostridia bacterium]|nr:hypothetical protein [Clostridia bacterium]